MNTTELKMQLEDDYGTDLGSQYLRCPICGEQYVHLEAVNSYPLGRGTAIEVRYWCESSHRFSIRQRFHKGMIYIETQELPKQDTMTELWRD